MSSSIPENVKAIISRLTVSDQVIIRSYIAGMRDELNELKVKLEHANEPEDPHAHYHGHEVRCVDYYLFVVVTLSLYSVVVVVVW